MMTIDYSVWAATRLREGAPLRDIQLDRISGPWLEWVGICRCLNGGDRRTAFDTWVREHPTGPDLVAQVFAAPTHLADYPEPETPTVIDPQAVFVEVPALPASARLTAAMERQANETGEFISTFADYIGHVVNTLPREMAEAAALTLASLAVARRLHLPAPFEDIYPILWTLWVAPSTIFHKTTALNQARRLARDVMPYLLLPQESSNDRLLQNMAGIRPSNFEQLSLFDQDQWRRAARHAGQRGIIVDEASSVFGSFDKEYNRGKIETFLTAYDCEALKVVETNKHGAIYLRHLYMPFLGATTPSSIQFANTTFMWESGFWPRFTLLVPERLFPERLAKRTTRVERPLQLAHILERLLKALPEPEASDPHTEPAPPTTLAVSIASEAWAHWQDYNDVMTHTFQHPDHLPDPRLRVMCGRLPAKLLQVAILLAALEWSPEQTPAPHITVAHYARAHQIAEGWRVNAYRFVELMSRKPDSAAHEQRLLEGVRRLTAGGVAATTREIVRLTHWPREQVEALLEQMDQDGLVAQERSPHNRTTVWKVVAG